MDAGVVGVETFEKFLTYDNQIIVYGCRLSDLTITGAVLSGGWIPSCPEARVERVIHSGTEMEIQLQAKESGFLKCVHIILSQKGNDISARADWVACATADHDYGFNLSQECNRENFDGLELATGPEGEDWDKGYGVAKLYYRRSRTLDITIDDNVEGSDCSSLVRVCVRPPKNVSGEDIRVGLHWVNDDDSYGGFILDKALKDVGNGQFQVDFTLGEVVQSVCQEQKCQYRFFPVVFFAPDGSYDSAYFKTEFGFATTNRLIVQLSDSNLENWAFKGFLTQQDQVVAHNVSLDRVGIIGGVLDGTWIGRNEANVQHVRRSAEEITLQLQARLDYLKCVCVSLRQAGPNVVARVNWAAYTSVDHDVGYEFSASSDNRVMIATSPDGDGYGVSELYLSVLHQEGGTVDACCNGSNRVIDVATSTAAIGGVAAFITGVTAAVTAVTASGGALAAIGTAGAGIGAALGGVIGSGIGIASGGTAIIGTIPLTIGGGALGGSVATSIASTCASALGIATAPAWAVPVAVCGGVAALGAGVFGLGRHCRWWK